MGGRKEKGDVFISLLSCYSMHCTTVGNGVYQRGVNFCIKLLNEGRWIHVFPEGLFYVCRTT